MRRHAAYWIAISAVLTTVTMPPLWSQCNFDVAAAQFLTINVAVNPSPSVYGQNVAVLVTTTPPQGCPTAIGFVTLTVDDGSVGNAVQLDANGNATITIPDAAYNVPGPLTVLPTVGEHAVAVSYGGPEGGFNYPATTSPFVMTAVTQASTTTLLSLSGTTLTATVSAAPPGSGSPTGSVLFLNGGSAIGSATVTNGQATFSVAGVAGLITASYSGDTNFISSSSAALRVGPLPTSVVALSSSLNPSTIGQSVTFTASLTVANGTAPARGTIQFLDGATLLGSPVPVSLGQASYTATNLAVGPHAIGASYGGDDEYPAASTRIGQVVETLSAALTLSALPTSPVTGQTVTLSAQIGPTPPTGVSSPTGQVTFCEGANCVGTNVLGVVPVSAAAAVLTLSTLGAGPHQIFAVYGGDTDWSSARSNTIALTVTTVSGPLTIVTASLPEGIAGVAYTAPAISASGGVPPYQWSITQSAPSGSGIALASDGTFSGTPAAAVNITLTVQVTDAQSTKVSKQFTLPVLGITTSALPGGTAGSSYSATVTAGGGTPPYTFGGSLPPNLTIDPATGAISGTPAASGTATLTVTVTDSAPATASKTFTVVFAQPLPPVPPLTISGVGNTGPAQQPALQVNLGANYSVDVSGTLTLTFQANPGGGDNPEVQFSTGGRTVGFTIPANSTAATFSIPSLQLQTGTVAGTITITADLKVGSTDVTPTPAPSEQIQISAAPPTISATAAHTATGFTVTVTGFSTTLDMSQAIFQFNAAAGANLQTTSITVPVGPLFSSFYQSAVPGPTGSQFVYTQPFTVNGSAAITSVTVTMTNGAGSSQAATATIQ